MPGLSRYDKLFGGAKGAADDALAAMKRTYGRKDGEQVFWGTVAKRKRRTKPRPPRSR